mmetsp:Transcript_76691/g.139475  ORF Transcript_76691/g.139475 Transcript_76691/m.139475 type:complete len:137 (-) Transcript_76691:63-473(-)
MSWRRSMIRACAAVLGVAGVAGLLYYLFREDKQSLEAGRQKSKKQQAKQSSKSSGAEKSSSVVQLDLDDLDPEERKLLSEVSKKGYYHGRPKSESTPSPKRVEGGAAAQKIDRRINVDDFQKKWDQFGREEFVKKL